MIDPAGRRRGGMIYLQQENKIMMRWKATIHYRTAAGILLVDHDFEEIHDLHSLVESGPHWDTIDKIEIILMRPAEDAMMTVEAAENR